MLIRFNLTHLSEGNEGALIRLWLQFTVMADLGCDCESVIMTYDLKLNYVCSAAVNKAKKTAKSKRTKRKLFKLKTEVEAC